MCTFQSAGWIPFSWFWSGAIAQKMKTHWDIGIVTSKCHIHDHRQRKGGRVYCVWSQERRGQCLVQEGLCRGNDGSPPAGRCLILKRPTWPLGWRRRPVADRGTTLKTLPQGKPSHCYLIHFGNLSSYFKSLVIFIIILRTHFNFSMCLFIH